MSDVSLNASILELGAQIEDLRNAMPKPPVTELTRSVFFKLSPSKQSEFIRDGGKVHNDAPAPQAPLPKNGIRRADFDRMSHPERHRVILGGHVIVD
jgi:hypothetical protein